MPAIIPPEKVAEVQRLLAAGRSQRWTAKQTRVGRATVQSIAHGRHCPILGRPRKVEEPVDFSQKDFGPLRRCPKGHLFYGPACRTCRTRIRRRRLFHVVESTERLESRLEPEEAARVLDALLLSALKRASARASRPRVHKSPAFRFHFGFIGRVFRLHLHPPIRIFPEVAR